MGDVKYFYSSIPLHRSLRSRVTSEKERAKACSLLDSSMLNRKKTRRVDAWPGRMNRMMISVTLRTLVIGRQLNKVGKISRHEESELFSFLY